jgi:hypothetical protein
MQQVEEQPQVPVPGSADPGALLRWATSLMQVATRYFQAVSFRLNRTLPKDGSEPMTSPLPLATYTTGTLPAAADYPWTLIAVTDGSAGQKFRASDGSSWVNLG